MEHEFRLVCCSKQSFSVFSIPSGSVRLTTGLLWQRQREENTSRVRVRESDLWVILQSTPASPRFIRLGCAERFLSVLLATSQLKTLPVSFSFSLPSFSELTGAK